MRKEKRVKYWWLKFFLYRLDCVIGNHKYGLVGENKDGTEGFIMCHICEKFKTINYKDIKKYKLYSYWDLTWGKFYKKFYKKKK